MKFTGEKLPSISAEEMESRRQIHEASRHSLALEGLDGFLSADAETLSQAWIRGEITLEGAIAQTLENVRANANSKACEASI